MKDFILDVYFIDHNLYTTAKLFQSYRSLQAYGAKFLWF